MRLRADLARYASTAVFADKVTPATASPDGSADSASPALKADERTGIDPSAAAERTSLNDERISDATEPRTCLSPTRRSSSSAREISREASRQALSMSRIADSSSSGVSAESSGARRCLRKTRSSSSCRSRKPRTAARSVVSGEGSNQLTVATPLVRLMFRRRAATRSFLVISERSSRSSLRWRARIIITSSTTNRGPTRVPA